MTAIRLFSIVTYSGTAMAEATLCGGCHGEAETRTYFEAMASEAADVALPIVWEDSTDNDAVTCIACADNAAQHAFEIRSETQPFVDAY